MDKLHIEVLPGSGADTRILKLQGPFTLPTIFEFQQKVRETPPRLTLIDLTDVPYMDSAAVGAIMSLHVSCQREGRKYGLVGASERLQTLFNVAGVDGILLTYPTIAEAESKAGASAPA